MNAVRENEILRRSLRQALEAFGHMSGETADALIDFDLADGDEDKQAKAMARLEASEVMT